VVATGLSVLVLLATLDSSSSSRLATAKALVPATKPTSTTKPGLGWAGFVQMDQHERTEEPHGP